MKTILKLLFFCCSFVTTFSDAVAQDAAGTLASNAKILTDVTEFFDFRDGLAVIKNNDATGVINQSGEIAIPFNKYRFDIDRPNIGFSNGMCLIRTATKIGFIDKSGKLIHPPLYSSGFNFLKEGYTVAYIYDEDKRQTTHYILRKDGSRIPLADKSKAINGYRYSNNRFEWNESRSPVTTNDPYLLKAGYIDETGKLIIPLQFMRARPFSEGLAAVSKKDDLGNEKWGFIDKSGKTVIPFQFSNEPFTFKDGVSFIKPLDIPDFKYGLINKNGEVVLKIKENRGPHLEQWYPWNGSTTTYGVFANGKALWKPIYIFGKNEELLMIDKTGVIHNFDTLIEKAGYKPQTSYEEIVNGEIIFKIASSEEILGLVGMIDTEGKITIPPVFTRIRPFDPVSNLAYAEIMTSKKSLQGYINRSGVFVIAKGKKTGF